MGGQKFKAHLLNKEYHHPTFCQIFTFFKTIAYVNFDCGQLLVISDLYIDFELFG
jgi:hypothetical protein